MQKTLWFCLFLSTSNLVTKNNLPQITFGDLIKIKHITTNQFLTSGLQSFLSNEQTDASMKDYDFKKLFLAKNPETGSLWIIKGAHASDLRWNCKIGDPIFTNNIIRLENLFNHCNLSYMNQGLLPITIQNKTKPFGIGSAKDELRLMTIKQSETESSNDQKEILPNQPFKIIFSSPSQIELELALSQTETLVAQNITTTNDELKQNSLWSFEVIENQFAKKINDNLETNIKALQNNKLFTEISGTEFSSIALWQDEITKQSIVAGINNRDFYPYVGDNINGNSITQKLDQRFIQICLAGNKTVWGITTEKKIKTAINKDLVFSDWQDTPGTAEIVVANSEIAYRLENIGGKLYKSKSLKPSVEWNEEPTLDNIVSMALGKDETLWWIDLDGKVFKQSPQSIELIFDYTNNFDPKFIKISAAGNNKNNYIALLRNDGKIFIAKNSGLIFDTEIVLARDVAIASTGIIFVAMQKLELTQGPIFKTDFKDLYKEYANKTVIYEKKFENIEDLSSYYHYRFELTKSDKSSLSTLIIALFESLENIDAKNLQDPELKDFLQNKLLTTNNKDLTDPAIQAIEKIKQLFLIANPKNTEINIKNQLTEQTKLTKELQQNNQEHENTIATLAEEKQTLEKKITHLLNEIDVNYKKIDELTAENKLLKNQNSLPEKETLPLETNTKQPEEEPKTNQI